MFRVGQRYLGLGVVGIVLPQETSIWCVAMQFVRSKQLLTVFSTLSRRCHC